MVITENYVISLVRDYYKWMMYNEIYKINSNQKLNELACIDHYVGEIARIKSDYPIRRYDEIKGSEFEVDMELTYEVIRNLKSESELPDIYKLSKEIKRVYDRIPYIERLDKTAFKELSESIKKSLSCDVAFGENSVLELDAFTTYLARELKESGRIETNLSAYELSKEISFSGNAKEFLKTLEDYGQLIIKFPEGDYYLPVFSNGESKLSVSDVCTMLRNEEFKVHLGYDGNGMECEESLYLSEYLNDYIVDGLTLTGIENNGIDNTEYEEEDGIEIGA